MTTFLCPAPGEMVAKGLSRLITQYREAEKFRGLLADYLTGIEQTAVEICSIPDAFDIETAVGDQLTLIGKRMGFPREHCVCELPPVFGFDCGAISRYPLVGFCETEETWAGCASSGVATVSVDDDEIYRSFLLARRYQIIAAFDADSLQAALGHIWGETAYFWTGAVGEVVVAPGRYLSALETRLLPVAARAIPVATGVRMLIRIGLARPFGFGAGWGEICTSEWSCPDEFSPDGCVTFVPQTFDLLDTGDGTALAAATDTGLVVGT